MHLVVIGLNHETAHVELRERVSIPRARLQEALRSLAAQAPITECVILSTCNRMEVYATTSDRAGDDTIIKWIGQSCGMSREEYQPHLYALAGHKAAEHLFRVAAGVDSLVIGEAQILGQVKEAYARAREAGCTGPVFNALFEQAARVGKRARTETAIGRGAFSVSSVAVQLAKSIFGELRGRTVLIVGASKMGELTMGYLASAGAVSPLVINRTYERAVDLASRLGGRPVEFESLPTLLTTADVVITATGAEEPIITRQIVSAAMHARRGRPLFFIDIAVPRDVEPGVGNLDNVFVYNIDDLQGVVKAGFRNRQALVGEVETIVIQEVEQFLNWFRTLDAVPVITAMREQFERIRAAEVGKLAGKLRHLSPQDLETVNLATRSIVNKISHQPMIRIKDYATREDAPISLDAICEIFGICPVNGEEDPHQPAPPAAGEGEDDVENPEHTPADGG